MMDQIEKPGEVESLSDADFKKELEALIPHLRAFARNLCGRADMADDLAQDALLKAWAARKRYKAGTNMRAWVFVILRNQFLSQMRRSRFKGEWDENVAERTLSTPAHQDHQMQLTDLQRALMRLPPAQREALILVGAGGFSYEEAASICDCAVGTVKSRVARARVALDEMIDNGLLPARSENSLAVGDTTEAIMSEMEKLVR
ncbi:MAG: RNA polymerase subunit sigma-70 [Parvibaculum sp.]|jgi:RNA polymerase sigma-70 factor (ECF subfamily)|uniref:sigma-70 family RNA polymerase sigma factor n=1 Tax=Parvibaculum sp. TaxID=2024848 RepID=UPI000C3E0B18|nr:sigma-70 family RNA polymerase sigma factor [Parvibaculum sp.]MAU61487.1 RNA polymerase subunit sigma-70 [Parvibaculum sp.]|tara:strand:+ start:26498 stop:27106 length:609 start_codon:yes stop_codon:yes gene_type:complete